MLSIEGCELNNELVSFVTSKLNVWFSLPPADKFVAQVETVCEPASSFTAVGLPVIVKLGTSLTGVMVIVEVDGLPVSPLPFAVAP